MAQPKLRFKREDGTSYPEWIDMRISEFANCFAGATPSTTIKEYWNNGTIAWLSSGEVNKKQIYSTEKKISQLGYDRCSTKMVKPNTVVMALAGQGKTRGTVAITRIGVCTNQSLCAIETDDIIVDDYLFQYLETQYDNLRHISSGDGTRGGLNLKLINDYFVPVPCIEEQQKIADFLSTVDEVIAQSEAEVQNLEQQKKAAMQKIFSQEVRFRSEDGKKFPEWEETTLGKIGEVAMCKRVLKEQTAEVGDVPFFKISTFGGVPDAYISTELYEKLKSEYRFPSKGAILISAAGTIGKTVKYIGENAYYQDSNIVWLEHGNEISDDFLYQFYQQVVWEGLEGSTIKRLYNKNLLETHIGVPCLEEQQKIADFFSDYDKAISYAKQELDKWKELKKGLLQQMFV